MAMADFTRVRTRREQMFMLFSRDFRRFLSLARLLAIHPEGGGARTGQRTSKLCTLVSDTTIAVIFLISVS